MITRESTNDIGMLLTDPWQQLVSFVSGCVGRNEYKISTDTLSALVSVRIEPEITAYELMSSSGGISFWDAPEEDIYTFEDGEAL